MTGPPRRKRVPLNRVFSALIAVTAVLVVIWAGWPLLLPSYLALSLLALREYGAMLRLRGIVLRRRSLWLAAALTLPATLPTGILGMPAAPGGLSWRELLLGLFALYLVGVEVSRPGANTPNTIVFTLFGYLYIPWAFGYVVTIRYLPDRELGMWYLGLVMLAIVASDVGAYLTGTLFGRRTLAPAISPNKTLEGALGGLGLAAVMVAMATLVLRDRLGFDLSLADALLLSLLVSSVAQLGDLFASLIKRWARVKDTGVFLPGHGGVLDRIDSSLLAMPAAYYFVLLAVL